MTTSASPSAPPKRRRGHSKKKHEPSVSDETFNRVMEEVAAAHRKRGRKGPSIPISESKSPWAKEAMFVGQNRGGRKSSRPILPPSGAVLQLSASDHEPFPSVEALLTFARREFVCVIGPEELESLKLPNVYAFGPEAFDPELLPTPATLKRFLHRQRQLGICGPEEKIGMLYPRSSLLLERRIPSICNWSYVVRDFALDAVDAKTAKQWQIGCAPLTTGPYPPLDLRTERERRRRPLPSLIVPWFHERAMALLLAAPLGCDAWHGETELTLFSADDDIYLGLTFDGDTVRPGAPDLATRICLY
jgi:hypothetical protein